LKDLLNLGFNGWSITRWVCYWHFRRLSNVFSRLTTVKLFDEFHVLCQTIFRRVPIGLKVSDLTHVSFSKLLFDQHWSCYLMVIAYLERRKYFILLRVMSVVFNVIPWNENFVLRKNRRRYHRLFYHLFNILLYYWGRNWYFWPLSLILNLLCHIMSFLLLTWSFSRNLLSCPFLFLLLSFPHL
jgi:hypothetical protein